MGFKQRLILFATALVAVSVLLTAAGLVWNARQELLGLAEAEGRLVALLLARSAGAAEHIPKEVEQVLGEQMISEALFAAHLVAIAEQAGFAPEAIEKRLAAIVANSGLDEVWITDEHGRAYLNSLGAEFTFSPDSQEQPQASAFWPLLTEEKAVVVQEAREREIDSKVFKYVGVGGVDKPRIVEVGYEVGLLRRLDERIGLEFMVERLVTGGDINAIWVLDPALETVAYGSVLGADRSPRPSERELAELKQVYADNQPHSFLVDNTLTVMAPVPGEHGEPVGAALVRLPTDRIRAAVTETLLIAGLIGLGVALGGGLLSVMVAGRVTRPVEALTGAAAAVQSGRFDPVTLAPQAERRDELGRLARVFQDMARQVFAREEELDHQVKARTRELEHKNRELESAHQMLHDELEVARTLQLTILPTEFPEHDRYQVYARMLPAREMGGDFYDVFRIDRDRLGVVVADVSGKGVPAAFFMAVARTELHSAALEGARPGMVLAAVNDALCEQNPLEMFVTVFYAILDTRTGSVVYANGGHNPPLSLCGGTVETLPGTGGTALGVMPGLPYREGRCELAQGDGLFLFTDGVTEAFDPAENPFGDERLKRLLEGSGTAEASVLTETVMRAVNEFSAGAPQSDDITCLALRFGSDRPGRVA